MRGALLASLALALLLGACGRASEDERARAIGGEGPGATLWVTRDRGAELLLEARVPAGLTVLEALKREAEVETRYGGRFVQAIEGIEGSLGEQQDWFYFVNGIEPDVGSAEVELRPGDVAWWDFRAWRGRMQQPVVVGAFPEPFLHGWNGRRRPAEVRGPPELAGEARALLATLGGDRGSGEPNVFRFRVEEGADGARLTAARGPRNDSSVTFTLAGSFAAVRGAAVALSRDPAIVRYRYEVRFNHRGEVAG